MSFRSSIEWGVIPGVGQGALYVIPLTSLARRVWWVTHSNFVLNWSGGALQNVLKLTGKTN